MRESGRQLELTALHLAEAGLVALVLYLPEHGAVDRGRRRFAFGLPVPRREGALHNGLAAQGLAGLFEHLGRRVDKIGHYWWIPSVMCKRALRHVEIDTEAGLRTQ